MNKLFKQPKLIYPLTGIVLLILGIFLIQKLTSNNDNLDMVSILGQDIYFTHTDDNTGEDLIIRSDKKIYQGHSSDTVYLEITNTRRVSELVDLQIYFNDNQAEATTIEKYDKNTNQWVSLSDQPLVLIQNEKKKDIPTNLVIKKSTEYLMESKEKAYFRMAIAYPPLSSGEFYIEALGRAGGYGLLDPWYDSSWRYKKKITIESDLVTTSTDRARFPVLVTTTDQDLANNARSDGYDILFTNSDNELLNYEREKYDGATGELVAWVQTDISSTIDTDIWMYYGKSGTDDNATTTGVWEEDFYAGVWHFSDTEAASTTDSTSNDNDGEVNGNASNTDENLIDGSFRFDTGDSIGLGPSDEILIDDNSWAMGLWFRYFGGALIDTSQRALTFVGPISSAAIFQFQATDDILHLTYHNGTTWGNVQIETLGNLGSDWHYVFATYDGETYRTYLDGNPDATAVDTFSGFGSGSASISSAGSFSFDGIIDEVRAYNIVHSAQWIETEYNNQVAVGEFLSFGIEEHSALIKVNTPLTNKLTDGLVGHWTFNGPDIDWSTNTAYDRSGQGNDGEITNMNTSTAAVRGKSGQALEFDGDDDYIDVSDDDTLSFTDGAGNDEPFSISLWINADENDAGHIMGKYIDNDPWRGEYSFSTSDCSTLGVDTGDNCVIFQINDDDAQIRLRWETDGSDIPINEWVHAVFTYDGNELESSGTIYINGTSYSIETDEQGSYPGMSNTDSPVQIGVILTESIYFEYFNGTIDEVRIYDRALSADEVGELYRAGARKLLTNVPLTNKLTDGLVGHWTFNGPDIDWSTNTAYDRSGQGNDGEITNMSTSTAAVRGKSGQALDFDGSGDYIDLGNTNYPFSAGGDFAISWWMKTNKSPAGTINEGIMGTQSAYDNPGFKIHRYGAGMRIPIAGTSSWFPWQPTGESTVFGTWRQYTFMGEFSGNDIIVTMYQDGNYLTSTQRTIGGGDFSSANFKLAAAKNYGGPGAYGRLNGILDEVRIYNRVLSADEIGELYRAGARKLVR